MLSAGHDDYPDHDDPDYVEPPEYREFEHDRDAGCGDVEWVMRVAPEFPRRELRRGMIGAVYVGYRLGEDLRVHDARVLAEVPQARFSEAALEIMKTWEARELPAGDPSCYRDLVTQFTFAID